VFHGDFSHAVERQELKDYKLLLETSQLYDNEEVADILVISNFCAIHRTTAPGRWFLTLPLAGRSLSTVLDPAQREWRTFSCLPNLLVVGGAVKERHIRNDYSQQGKAAYHIENFYPFVHLHRFGDGCIRFW